MQEVIVTGLYLDEQIVRMQLVFGLMVVAFLLLWVAFVKLPGSDKNNRWQNKP